LNTRGLNDDLTRHLSLVYSIDMFLLSLNTHGEKILDSGNPSYFHVYKKIGREGIES